MDLITLRINSDEKNLIKDYAKANNITISELVRQSVLEKIEDDIDIRLYEQAMKEHIEDPTTLSFEEASKELGFNTDEL